MKLQLSLTTEWFEKTKIVKTEDYRSITSYFVKRLMQIHEDIELSVFEEICEDLKNPTNRHASLRELMDYFAISFKPFTTNIMTLGYPKKGDPERTLIFEHAGIEIGYGNPEWGAPTDRMVFIIKHGKRIEL